MREVWYNDDMNESDFTLTGAERVEIPPQCEACSVLKEELRRIENLYEAIKGVMEMSMDSNITEFFQAKIQHELKASGLSDDIVKQAAENFPEASRQEYIRRAEHLDEEVDRLSESIKCCPGAVTMSKIIGHKVIEATICMHPIMDGPSEHVEEPVSVTRRLL